MRLLFFWLVYCLATACSFLFSIDGNFLLNDGTFFETMDIPLESFQHNFPEHARNFGKLCLMFMN